MGRTSLSPAPLVATKHDAAARRRRFSSTEAGPGRVQIAEIQRSRLLAAAAETIDERGYLDTTVADVTQRAGVSRRTFYELFGNREDCLTAVLEEVVGLIQAELADANLDGLDWHERIRIGLWVILSFLDLEPMLARVCVVQATQGGPAVLKCREAVLARLAVVVDAGRRQHVGAKRCTPLVAEGVIGAAFMILQARLSRREATPLTSLQGELVAMIVLPYLGPAAAHRERTRLAPPPSSYLPHRANALRRGTDPLEGIPMRLTYRTARVLEGIAANAGASNREVADHAEIHDQGQVSKLLARLERLGLLTNRGAGHAKGEPNAWVLTTRGERVARSIRIHQNGDCS